MSGLNEFIDKIIEAIDTRQSKKPKTRLTQAEVRRVDPDGTVWVHIPGGAPETPCDASTAVCEVGDFVQCQVGNGRGVVLGNTTRQATDDTLAKQAEEKADRAIHTAHTLEAEAGGAIQQDIIHYLATSLSSGVTTDTPGWSTTIQNIDSINRYLWTYHTYELINGNTVDTAPIITGVYGDKGDEGDPGAEVESIQEVIEYYLATSASSGVTRSTSGWTTTIQTTTPTKRYLWNYEEVIGTKGSTLSLTDPVIIGTHGANGVGIASITEYYLASSASSGVTINTPGWTTTVQTTTTTKRYLWNYEVVMGTDGNVLNTTDPAVIGTQGTNGTNGTNGISISSVTEYYLATSASSGVTWSTPGWTTSVQTTTSTNRYLWNYEVITGSNSQTLNRSDPAIIGTQGDSGVSISSITEYYLASSQSSGVTWSTSGWTTTVQSTTSEKRFLWNYEIVNGSNGSELNKTQPVIIGTQGMNGHGISQITTHMRVATYATIMSWVGLTNDTWSGVTAFDGQNGDTVLIACQISDMGNAVGYMRCVVKGYNSSTQILTTDNLDFMLGEKGEAGVSVTAVQPQYYLSTSSSSLVGGQWGNTLTYVSGYYIWTREQITYSNGTVGYSTAIYDQALTSACSLSYNTAQYFWTKTSGGTTNVPTGAYVTEKTQKTYDDAQGGTPTGGSVLIRSTGVYLRMAAKTLVELLAAGLKIYEPNDTANPAAQFLSSGAILGKENGIHTTIGNGLVRHMNAQTILSEIAPNYMTLASGKGRIKYSEDGSAFGLDNSHRIVVCKGTDESGVRNDATLSSMDMANWNSSKPMAFFNVTHSTINGTKSAGGGLYVLDGSGNISNLRYAVLTNSGIFETSGDIKAGSISVHSLDTTATNHGNAIATLQDDMDAVEAELADIKSKFAYSTETLYSSTSIAKESYKSDTKSISKSGYYPMAISGWSATASQHCPARLYLSAQNNGSGTISYMIRNTDESAAHSGTFTAHVLWVKT